MQDGKQVEHWGGPDTFSFLVQLGVMPGPGTDAFLDCCAQRIPAAAAIERHSHQRFRVKAALWART
jgi:hypothetical protein